MCMTKSQISELNHIVDRVNTLDDAETRLAFLKENVEDVDFFLEVLKKVNRNNLRLKSRRSTSVPRSKERKTYEKEDVIAFFKKNSLESIVAENSKAELTAMYYAIYQAKPLSADNKLRIAQTIKMHIHSMERAKALLG